MKDGVSIVVCCYNSENRLPETIKHLGSQKADDINWEIIIVDNASTDDTAKVAENLLKEYCVNIDHKVVHEATPGLNPARIKGFEEATYELVLFVDDDNWLCDTYVSTVYEDFRSNPEIGIVGGNAEAEFEIEPPFWFEKFKENFAVGKQGNTGAGVTAKVDLVYGAGFTVRKSIYNKLKEANFSSILTDRVGDSLISGGDNELCIVAGMAGYEVWYDSRLKFKHYMTKGRLTWDYLKKLYFGFGQSKVYLATYRYCLNHDEPPKKKGKLPVWKDRLEFLKSDYRKKKLKFQLTNLRKSKVGSEEYLNLIGKLGQIEELKKIGSAYEDNFVKVLELKKKLQNLQVDVS